MSYLVLRGGRPSGALCPSGDPGATTAGLQLFQCATTCRGSPFAKYPTRSFRHESPIFSSMGKGPSYCPPRGVGLCFRRYTWVALAAEAGQ